LTTKNAVYKNKHVEEHKMLKMVWNSGDEEQVIELTETPEFVLINFCDIIIRKQDLRNPDVRYMLRETVNALKVKAEGEPDGYTPFDRRGLKEHIAQIEDLLKKFEQE
jgi:hypothetical protein